MPKSDFSSKLKNDLLEIVPHKKCCEYIRKKTNEYFEDKDICLSEIASQCRCESCKSELVRNIFLKKGYITDPQNSYQLDIVFENGTDSEFFISFVNDIIGIEMHPGRRNDKYTVYLKNNDDICDFLALIGANSASFTYMNEKIMKELRNNVNRQVNCDSSNIKKTIETGKKYIECIEKIKASGKYQSLPAELKEAAELRINNPQLSLSKLGQMCSPPISKSGMKNRLDRLPDYLEY